MGPTGRALKRATILLAVGGVLARAVGILLHLVHRRRADVAPVWLPEHVTPSPQGDGLFIAVNTESGSDGPPTEDLRRLLPEATIEEVDVVEGSELERCLERAATSATVIGVCGGDGSINTAAKIAIENSKPLVVIPGGTFNHLGHSLGLTSVEDAVEAVREGHAVCMDVGSIDGYVFVNTASFGSYVQLVDARKKLESKIGKWAAILVALVRVLRTGQPLDIEIDGNRCRVWMAFIGNCRYDPSGFAPTRRTRLDDGLLDFRYVDGSHPWARARLIAAILTGWLGRSRVYREATPTEIRVRSLEGPMRLARDGETFEASDDVEVKKLPRSLVVYASPAVSS
ncbi:MAG TPA: diacylglycerol kinase family protein [Actinomycetota bacterium]|nr:diacylglycerol kinase family protein [Actinomycetota bacterium]